MRPAVIAHRGASGHAHENSLAAFRQAVTLGADAVELDIHATTDGALLVHHDAVVRGVGVIGELPRQAFAEYRLSNGQPIPTLPEALTALAGLAVWIEVKTLPPAQDGALLATIDHGPTPAKYAVHGFDHRIVARLGRQRPTLRRGVLLASYLLDVGAVLRGAGATALWMETHLIDAELVAQVRGAGAELIAWTANEPAEIARLIGLGVDGICGNFPERILRAREAVERA
jgi:glycerophosphoryl diester phosphodiesterase